MIFESNLEIYINNRLIKGVHNSYHNDIKGFMHNYLYSNVTDKFIRSTNLFTTVDTPANNVDKDGIILFIGGGNWRTLITTEDTPDDVYEKCWLGTMVNPYPFDASFSIPSIGRSCNTNATFDITYATLPSGIFIEVPEGNTLRLYWHLRIGEAV